MGLLLCVIAACAPVEGAEQRRLFIPLGPRNVFGSSSGATATPTRYASATPGPSRTVTSTRQPIVTKTTWATSTAAPGVAWTATATPTLEATRSIGRTPTVTATLTPTGGPTRSPTASQTATAIATTGPGTPTASPVNTPTPRIIGGADSFNRADASSLGRADSGYLWQTDGSAWGICGGQACTNAPANESGLARLEANLMDQNVAIVVPARPTDAAGQAAVLARVAWPWGRHLVYAGLNANGTVALWTLIDNAWSDGALTEGPTAFDGTASRTLRLRVVGASATVSIDEVVVLGPIAVPAAPADATSAGLFIETTDPQLTRWPRFDAFRVDPG